jgi:hypothetical protein
MKLKILASNLKSQSLSENVMLVEVVSLDTKYLIEQIADKVPLKEILGIYDLETIEETIEGMKNELDKTIQM